MRNHNLSLYQVARVLIIAAIGLLFSGIPARAQASLSGTYNCVSVEIAGKTHHCTAPSLEMNSDGSYQILAERGTYEILRGHWLILSAAKNHGYVCVCTDLEAVTQVIDALKADGTTPLSLRKLLAARAFARTANYDAAIAGWFGIRGYPPAVLFAVGILFILAVLLHYSTVISRLSDQNVVLAQRIALLEQELRQGEGGFAR